MSCMRWNWSVSQSSPVMLLETVIHSAGPDSDGEIPLRMDDPEKRDVVESYACVRAPKFGHITEVMRVQN